MPRSLHQLSASSSSREQPPQIDTIEHGGSDHMRRIMNEPGSAFPVGLRRASSGRGKSAMGTVGRHFAGGQGILPFALAHLSLRRRHATYCQFLALPTSPYFFFFFFFFSHCAHTVTTPCYSSEALPRHLSLFDIFLPHRLRG